MSSSTERAPRRRPRLDLLVLAAGLLVVGAVWLLSCWWSFSEQTRAADSLHFRHPSVLPWMLDALAVALALVALGAALNGQSAGTARLGVLAALAGSVWANTQGVSLRFAHAPERDALVMAAIAPLSAYVALEVILGRIRRLVLWLRGEPAPAAIPALRLVRLLLAPRTSFAEWRTAVLARTAPNQASAGLSAPGSAGAAGQGQSTDVGSPAAPAHLEQGTTLAPPGVVPVDAGRGLVSSPDSPRSGPDSATPAPAPVSAVGGQGLSGVSSAPPAPSRTPLSVVPPDGRRTGVSAATGPGVRTVVAAVPDTRAPAPSGHPSDTPAGHPDTTRTPDLPDTRTPGPDTASPDSARTPGHPAAGQVDPVSALLLSGESVRTVAQRTGQSKTVVGDRRRALVETGLLKARGAR